MYQIQDHFTPGEAGLFRAKSTPDRQVIVLCAK
jgi:hypothetical protein